MMLNDKDVNIMQELDLKEMEDFLLPNGHYVLPQYKELMKFSKFHHAQFGNKHAMYTLPTIELVESLKILFGDSRVVEIGSGNGVLGKALNIKCTDNYCQYNSDVKAMYRKMQQPTIKYGDHVLKRDAEWVARKYKPDIIFGSWITHKWHDKLNSGNIYGPDEEIILDNCKRYILLGNENVHRDKPILKHNPDIIKNFTGYVTRSKHPELNCLYIWKGRL